MLNPKISEIVIRAFQHLYPHETTFAVSVENDVCTVTSDNDDIPPFRALIHSDNDEYLRFTVFDDDDEPCDDDYDFLSIRILIKF